jgi:hypothetical protein
MVSRLQNGNVFPDLAIDVIGGGTLALPRDLAGSYAVILFYRGGARIAAHNSRPFHARASSSLRPASRSSRCRLTTRRHPRRLQPSCVSAFLSDSERTQTTLQR